MGKDPWPSVSSTHGRQQSLGRLPACLPAHGLTSTLTAHSCLKAFLLSVFTFVPLSQGGEGARSELVKMINPNSLMAQTSKQLSVSLTVDATGVPDCQEKREGHIVLQGQGR